MAWQVKIHSGAMKYILSYPNPVHSIGIIFNNQMLGITYIFIWHVHQILF
jgi:hypothetical protein